MADVADEQDDDAPRTGGMIALVPRAADAASMAADGGDDVAELHLTLAYLGDDVTEWPGEQVAELLDAARAMAADFGPVTSRVLAHTVFNADGAGDKDPCAVYLMSDAPALVPIQGEAVSLTDVEQHEPHIPHVTAGYGLGVDALTHTGTVVFDRLRVALGGQVTDFELTDEGNLDDDDDDDALDVEEKAAPEPTEQQAASSGRKRKVASEAGEERYGLPIGTELGQARNTESAKRAQADPGAKARYDEFMRNGDTPAMKASAGKLGDDDLKSLTAVMYSFKTSNPRVVAARNALAAELRRRGFDERDHGSLVGGKRAAAKAKGSSGTAAKRKGSMSGTEDRAWRRRASDSGGRILADSLTDDALKKLKAAGWAGRAGDGTEALYPPSQSKDDGGYLGEHYEEKARYVRTPGGVQHFRKPIGSPITATGLSVRGAMTYASVKNALHAGVFKQSLRRMDDETFDEVAQMLDVDADLPADRIRLLDKERRRRAAGGPPMPEPTPWVSQFGADEYGDDDPVLGSSAREQMVIKGADVDDMEIKRTTSKPWETGDLKKAGHTVSKEKGAEGDKYPIKTIGDLAAAVKRAKAIKDPEQRAKVWKHLRAEAKRLKAPNMVPADAPGSGGDGKKKGGGFVPFKKGESKRAVDYLLSPDDRRVLAALEFKYASPDPRARRLRKYWASGPGRAKWNSFRELRRHLSSKGVPAQMLNGLTANIYHAAKGEWPGRKAEKALDDTTEHKVMISADLLEQMHEVGSVVPEMDDESALDAYEEMAATMSVEDDYEQALVREVDWDMGLDGELEREDTEQPERVEPGMFDDDFEPLPDAEEDLLSAFGG